MNKKTAQRWLNRAYWIRDLFVGWYFKKMTWKDFLNYATTPWKTWIFWQLGMRYIFDKEDYAQLPKETWDRRGGDCEDMAWFCRCHIQAMFNYPVAMFRAVRKERDKRGTIAHIVCLFDDTEKLCSKDDDTHCWYGWKYMGTGLIEYSSAYLSLREIADEMVGSKNLAEYGIIDFDEKIRKWYYIEKIIVNS